MLKKIIFVENNKDSGKDLKNCLEDLGYEIAPFIASDREELNKVQKDKEEIIFADISQHHSDEYIRIAEKAFSRFNTPVIYFDMKNRGNGVGHDRKEPLRIIITPLESDKVNSLIKDALEKQSPVKTAPGKDIYSVFNSYGEGVIMTDAQGVIEYINPSAEKITGDSREESIGRTLPEIFRISYKGKKKSDQLVASVVAQQSAVASKAYHVLKNKKGNDRKIEYNCSPVFEEDKVNGTLLIFRDVTEKLKKENEKKRKFKFAIQHSHEIIFMTDTEGVIDYVNPQFEKFYGYSKAEIKGQTPRVLKSGIMDQEFYNYYWDSLRQGKNINAEFINKTKLNKFVNVEVSTSPIIDSKGNITGYISIQRDISDKKQNEELLRRALDKAEESDKLKTAFLNQMSHEIRTPLNSILGFMSLMEEELVNKGMSDMVVYFDSINRSTARLQRTIEDILAMSSIQIGNYYTSVTDINLDNIIKLLMKDFNSLAAEKNLDFEFNNRSVISYIRGDAYTVIQSFQHLIDNALKFTNEGKVEITVYNEEDVICVDIRDTGIGISNEYMENIFKPFSQEEIGYNRKYDGNGLGLAITKEYLRLNHAKISVVSQKGEGTTFTIRFYNIEENEENGTEDV